MSRDELEQAFRESFSRGFSKIPETDAKMNYKFFRDSKQEWNI